MRQDLEENRILPALIQGDYGDCERSAAEEVASKCARACTLLRPC
jgi:hypothetical protein